MKTNTFLSLFLALTGVIFLTGCQPESSSSTSETPVEEEISIPFSKEGTLSFERSGESYLTIDIEIADTDSAIVRGLMQRTSLPELGGMLFLMPSEEPQEFWMSNTLISLDILFANSENEIVSISRYTTPLSQENVKSIYPALYVIEMAAGFVDTHGILEGDTITWQRE